MMFELDGKFYILASNKYREVKVNKDLNGGYDIKVVEGSEPIERSEKIKSKIRSISVEEAFKKKKKVKNID